jgi:transcriptional regulator with XRE-family HTH domain
VGFRQYRTYPYLKDPRVRQLGDKIREQRAEGGGKRTVHDLSEASGVSEGAIRSILKGKTRSPYNRTVAALGIALNFTEAEWMQHLRRAAPTAVPMGRARRAG